MARLRHAASPPLAPPLEERVNVPAIDTLDQLRALLDGDGAAPPHVRPASVPFGPEGRAAFQQALRLLSMRGYPTQELRRRLLRRHEPAAVEAALQALAGSPFLDDAAWAAAHVAGLRGRYRSAALLRRELAAKGVRSEDATAALEAHDDDAAALAAAAKRVGALAHLDPAARSRRLRDYLLRRGFASGAVRSALDRVLGDSAGS
jgi:regulatory protein